MPDRTRTLSAVEFGWTPRTGRSCASRRARWPPTRSRGSGVTTTRGSTGSRRSSPRSWPALGWIGLTWPKEFGGQGRPAIDRLIIGEELIAAGAPIAAMWFADRQMGPSLIAYGRPDQQQAFLPGILSGETTWCIGMSEPNAGSDLASLVTSAVRDGDEFVINGQKIWTSFGAVADYIYLICRTSHGGLPHEGISEIDRADDARPASRSARSRT